MSRYTFALLLSFLLICSDLGGTATAAEHWAFQPVKNPAPPAAVGGHQRKNAVDDFIQTALVAKGLAPAAVADRRTVIRRLYLTMHGLPPSTAQVDAFLADTRADAYEQLVEAVLASPRYGERSARHWMDVVRYADTNGFETNRERKTAYPFRDWIIEAFNADKPYDAFVREQLAGDALGADAATGFLVAGAYDIVKSPDINLTLMQRQDELADMVNTTGTAFMALTVGCARCHNHKFDPIPQSDFYAMQAVFAGVEHGERALHRPSEKAGSLRPAVNAKSNEDSFPAVDAVGLRFTILATNSAEPCLDELEIYTESGVNIALASLGATVTASGTLPGYAIHKLEHLNDGLHGNEHSWISHTGGSGWVEVHFPSKQLIHRTVWGRDRKGRFQDRLATKYRVEIVTAEGGLKQVASEAGREVGTSQNSAWLGNFKQPEKTHLLYRGDPLQKRQEIAPDGLSSLGSLGMAVDEPEQQRRLKFARWLTSPQHPLTARVMVNRLWQNVFGTGLVATSSDFGRNGALPTHPELLDWLATEFMTHGWSVKHIQRLILRSATFQQSSEPQSASLAVDAASQYLWRFPPRRLEAEAIRDAMLQVSGGLDLRMGGPGFYLMDVVSENVMHYFAKEKFTPAEFRRMVYQFRIRQTTDSVFSAFDCPDGGQVVPRRSRSNTPLQALNLFNSSFVLQQADMLAARLIKEAGSAEEAQVQRAFAHFYSRHPDAWELAESAAHIRSHGLAAFCRALYNTSEFLFLF